MSLIEKHHIHFNIIVVNMLLNLQVDDDEQALNDEPPIPPARKKVSCRYDYYVYINY